MDREDICLSVFLCICADEGMGDKSRPIIPVVFAGEGIGYKTRLIIPAGLRISGAQQKILPE